MDRTRNWCFTLNNFTEDEEVTMRTWITKYCKYAIIGREVGDSGTPHLQGFLMRNNPGTLSALRKVNGRAHFEPTKGSPRQNYDYCSKGGIFWEHGNIADAAPGQGARGDIAKLKDKIVDGTPVDHILMENPYMYHQYGRTLSKIEDLVMRRSFRTEMTIGFWLWGRTGIGKSHIAFEDFDPSTHYLWPNDNGWWDGYTQQETVIINDFRGEIPYGFLLQLIDKWPVSVRRRNREPMPFTSKRIIITSSLPPAIVYKGVKERDDNIDQLLRRLHVFNLSEAEDGTNWNSIFFSDTDTEVVKGNTISLTTNEPTWTGITPTKH